MKNKKHIMVFKRTGFIQSRELLRQRSAIESRRDDILLTVDFNLRNVKTLHATSLQSPAGTIQAPPQPSPNGEGVVLSLRDFVVYSSCWLFRRLKSTVNKVLSLHDISSLTQYFYKFFISRA